MARTRTACYLLVCAIFLACVRCAPAAILWSDLGSTLVHESGPGVDILGGALKRDDSSSDTLYFKFHVDPLSDLSTEEYLAAFELYEGDTERLAVGNSEKAWAYSAFNTAAIGEMNKVYGDVDLHSSKPESSGPGAFLPYELPRRGIEITIVFKVQYVAGGDDQVTVWLNPNLAPGATEDRQSENLTTKFGANASFNQIRLRHSGGGAGWTFGDITIATSFSDLVAANPQAGSLSAVEREDSLFTFRTWQREQGLPQNSVHALTQTRDGYIWIGCDDGVARFDGVRFVSFGLREGLRSGRVRALFEDSRGTLWVGTTGGGLSRWQEGRFVTLTIHDGLPADSISALAEDGAGRLWIGTEAGLAVYQNGKLGLLPAAAEFKGRAISILFRDRQGTMWVGVAGTGIFEVVEDKFVPLKEPTIENLLRDPHSLLVDRAGRLWVGAGDDFVLCRENSLWRRYRIPRHLARPYISSLTEQPEGTLWAGSVSEGLFQFKGGKATTFSAGSGLSDNFVEALLADKHGNVWVGTALGLNRLRRKSFSAFGQAEGLGYGAVQGLTEVTPGIIWAGKPSDGLYRWEGRSFSRFGVSESSARFLQINSLLMADDASCWVAAAEGLLHFPDPKNIAARTEPPMLTQLNVTSLADNHNGSIWAGTREGEVWLVRDGKATPQTNYWQAHAITAILRAPSDDMWIGTEGGGLYHFKEGKRMNLDKESGLLSDLIRTLYLDREGTVWIGTAGGGLSRWRAGRLSTITTREGLPDNTISQILEDDAGRLWLGSNRGIAGVSKRELEDLAAGKITAVYPQVYGRAEGMPSEECTGGFCPAGLRTKAGLLCFSTSKGIVVIDPRPSQSAASPPPTVLLEEVIVDGAASEFRTVEKRQAAANSVRLRPGKHRLELRYTGLSFDAPDRVRFRFRLQGLDPDWVEAGGQRTAFYSYVPPGDYRFAVTACSAEGIWNQAPTNLEITVLPHFWQAWWFIGLGSLGLLLSVGGGVRLVEKRKHQKRLWHLEQERALERERARIAQDLHDDLGSSLTRISLLSDLAKADKDNPDQVKTHAEKISQSADQTVRALEEIVWALRPGSDSLQSLIEYIAHFANELFEADSTRCRLDLPHDLPARPLPPEMRHNIFLVIKEALTNTLKHARAREVRVQAKATNSSLEILVQDDGRGFEAQQQANSSNGHGLGNMRRRAEAMGGRIEISSTPGSGTMVRLFVLLRRGTTAEQN